MQNRTYTWEYDDAGNILEHSAYSYSTGALGSSKGGTDYYYEDSEWGDLLTFGPYGEVDYDQIGNPLLNRNWSYTWQHGRELVSMGNDDETWTYTYDANGMRTQRTNGTTTYKYYYNGSQLSRMTIDNTIYDFTYDANGTPLTITRNGEVYYYVTNLQGDVVGILNDSGTLVADYVYDAWGNFQCGGSEYLEFENPLTYRGYVYDQETGLYYLQSRYYDPQNGRFINADGFVSTGQGVLGNNMFAYCNNNPIMHKDISGALHERTAGGGGVFSNPGGGISLFQIIKDEVMNEDPAEALDDDTLNFYKGVPVIKTPGMDNASFSFGVIFIGNDINDPTLLKHEYGHVLQLQELGISEYIVFVVVPSVTCFWATADNPELNKYYYCLPWENIADQYGNADNYHISGSTELANMYWSVVKVCASIKKRLCL